MEEPTALTPPPEKSLFDLWIEMLRSGKFKQSRNFLRTSKGYCCMGVLWEAAHGQTWETSNHEVGVTYQTCDEHVSSKLTPGQLRRFGLHSDWQEILVLANDSPMVPATFEEIAKFVEEHKNELGIPPVLRWRWNERTRNFVYT